MLVHLKVYLPCTEMQVWLNITPNTADQAYLKQKYVSPAHSWVSSTRLGPYTRMQ